MNKKFLSAILFGALMVTSTGTFVSCKDYDDDIKGLQEQIDKLATKDDLKAQITTLQTGLTSAAKDASDAITKATAAETAAKAAGDAAAAAKAAADKAVAEAKAEAIKAVQAEIEALKEEVNASTEASLEAMRKEVAEATKKVEDIIGKIADMVTSVELVESYSVGQGNDLVYSRGKQLGFMTAIEKENVFSTGITNAITFTKGKQVQTGDKFLVRVSPTNAVLTPEMISLTNSKGQNLNDFITVQNVEKYDGLLSRAASNTGLWEVTVALNSYDKDAFAAATETKVGDDTEKILFAVHVNNTLSTAETREVTSSYDLNLSWKAYAGVNALNYFVDKTNVEKVHNRYSASENGTSTTFKELAWSGDASTTVIAPDKANANTKYDASDNRQAWDSYPAIQGQAVKIALSTETSKVTAPTNIRAMYVVLDKANAVESAPSEINAWNSYSYTGLNTVVEGTSTEIIINSNTAINDVIGFRVYAVNFDGTLVDPDGKAFYVVLGNQASSWNAVATSIYPMADQSAPTAAKSEAVSVATTKLTNAGSFTWSTDKVNDITPAFDTYFYGKDGKTVVFATNGTYSAAQLQAIKFEEITKAYTMPTIGTDVAAWQKYEDGKAYNGTLTIKNTTGHVLTTLNVSMTKVLPTTLPEGFSVKTAQVSEGIYNCYMIPMNDANTVSWGAATATKGSMKMTEVFNFGKGAPVFYNITFAASAKDNNKDIAVTKDGTETLEVAKAYINNKDKHATTVVYNYGKVSSKKNAKGEYEDVTIAATNFETIYNCIYNSTYTWKWATNAQMGGTWAEKDDKGNYKYTTPSTSLTYGTDYTMKGSWTGATAISVEEAIFGTSSWDGIYSKLLSTPYSSSLKIESATLTSDANGEEEYFKVTVTSGKIVNFVATATSSTTNPTAAVASTLTISCKDMYDHAVTIKMPMTVNRR